MLRKMLNILRNAITDNLLVFVRYFYWKLLLNKLGSNVKFYGRIKVLRPDNIFIGDNCTFNEYVLLNARDNIYIGDNVTISSGVTIHTAGLICQSYRKTHFSKKVSIEDGVWVGSNATILPGVTIGVNSIIGAGAVVVKDVPPSSVVVGVPARIIKKLVSSPNVRERK